MDAAGADEVVGHALTAVTAAVFEPAVLVLDLPGILGGVAGEAVEETSDEDPTRVAPVADAVAAYLLDVLGEDATGWQDRQEDVTASSGAFGIESE